MLETKKGLRKDVIYETNKEFDGGMKQMWVGTKGILGSKQTTQTRE